VDAHQLGAARSVVRELVRHSGRRDDDVSRLDLVALLTELEGEPAQPRQTRTRTTRTRARVTTTHARCRSLAWIDQHTGADPERPGLLGLIWTSLKRPPTNTPSDGERIAVAATATSPGCASMTLWSLGALSIRVPMTAGRRGRIAERLTTDGGVERPRMGWLRLRARRCRTWSAWQRTTTGGFEMTGLRTVWGRSLALSGAFVVVAAISAASAGPLLRVR